MLRGDLRLAGGFLHPFLSGILEHLSVGTHWSDEQILREEIFSIERLEQHARTLAAAQPSSEPGFRRSLALRLRNNEKVLLAAYRAIARAVDEGRTITPAAEWVLDNYHVVEEQIREIREDLPPGFYRQLPKLAAGPFAGLPRVFGIAWAYVAHTDSRFDPETLRRFVRAYQTRRAADHRRAVGGGHHAAHRAGRKPAPRRAAHRRSRAGAPGGRRDRRPAARRERPDGRPGRAARPGEPVAGARRRRSPCSWCIGCATRTRRSRPALEWLEEELDAGSSSSERLVQEEHQRQGASNVTVRNIITSMRLMSDVDWAEFFESVSLVDEALNTAQRIRGHGFRRRATCTATPSRSWARGSTLSELQIARRRARPPPRRPATPRERDPGFHLIADGRRALERAIGFPPSLRDWPSRIAFTVGARGLRRRDRLRLRADAGGPAGVLQHAGISGGMLWLLGVLGAVPAIDIAVALVNRAVTRGVGASRLPGLALRDGMPAAAAHAGGHAGAC